MITLTQQFAWHVASYISVDKEFSWYVGEGPLYWYRIEWCTPGCPPNDCNPDATECQITPSDCVPVETHDNQFIIWHMMASSVSHLCERLNTECCQIPPTGKVFKSVKVYNRPALCCDVENFQYTDEWIEVGFCECECVKWVDPYICGNIDTPCDPDSCASFIPSMALIGQTQKFVGDGFAINEIAVMKPKVSKVNTKFGSFSSNFKLRHNIKIDKVNLSKQVELIYDKKNTWSNVLHFNLNDCSWHVSFSLRIDDGCKFDVCVTKRTNKDLKAKISIDFKTYNSIIDDISFNINTNTKMVAVKSPLTVSNKLLFDDIGLFKGNWEKDPYLIFDFMKG